MNASQVSALPILCGDEDGDDLNRFSFIVRSGSVESALMSFLSMSGLWLAGENCHRALTPPGLAWEKSLISSISIVKCMDPRSSYMHKRTDSHR